MLQIQVQKESDRFFFGLFGDGESTEITIKMGDEKCSCVLYHTYIFTFYCSMGNAVAISSLGKLLTRSKKLSILKIIIRKKE